MVSDSTGSGTTASGSWGSGSTLGIVVFSSGLGSVSLSGGTTSVFVSGVLVELGVVLLATEVLPKGNKPSEYAIPPAPKTASKPPAPRIRALPRDRRGPSIFKMLFQWFGGGALGIGGALAILYFVFPTRYPEFLPFQPNSSTTNETSSPTQGGFTDEFVPRSASRDGTGSSFVSANENAHLLESMNVGQPASSDNEPPETVVEPSVPETSIPESPPEGTIFLEKHDAVLAALEQKKQSPPKDLKRRTAMLYRALAELGHTTIDNHTVQTRKRAGKLLGDISEPKTVQELEQLIPLWLSRSQVSDGFVAVGTVGTRITPEARSGFSSVELKWHGSDSTPITILGLTNELSKLRGKRVITIGALERSVSGIAKSGKVMEVAAIHTLPSP